ncbi:MAG: UDP-N-acetylmuramate dehydrogenase [Patescibacteria group bacterium]
MFFPENERDIFSVLWFCTFNRIPYFILGGGSNTVFDDRIDKRQAVINLTNLDKINLSEVPDLRQHAKKYQMAEILPGCKLQTLVDLAQQYNLAGVTGLNRVPGTVGGAVIGNAGAYGCEIGDVVDSVEYLDLEEVTQFMAELSPKTFEVDAATGLQIEKLEVADAGHLFYFPEELIQRFRKSLNNKECRFGYRDSFFKQHSKAFVTKIFVKLEVQPEFATERAKYFEIAEKRDVVYPPGFISPGSTFKNILFSDLNAEQQSKINPEWVVFGNKLPAGKLLEEIGAKGYQVGQMIMRPTHANIMVNLGGGKYEDVKKLIETLQSRVMEKFGIHIEPEIRLVSGDFSKFKH